MDKYIEESEIRKYLFIPQNFDAKLIDQSVGFTQKIFPYFSDEFLQTAKFSTDEKLKSIYDNVMKAGIRYSFILSIPALKVHISNFGINEFNQGKEKAANWWNVRDYGNSLLKAADTFLSDALDIAYSDETIKSQLPFFETNNSILPTPSDVDTLFSIGKSPEVYSLLLPFLKRATDFIISEKLEPCSLEDIYANEDLKEYLQDALLFYALKMAEDFPGFIFLSKQLVVQYEELPWQKSLILTENQKARQCQSLLNMADQNIDFILKYISKNLEDFPCYQDTTQSSPQIYKRPGGLFL